MEPELPPPDLTLHHNRGPRESTSVHYVTLATAARWLGVSPAEIVRTLAQEGAAHPEWRSTQAEGLIRETLFEVGVLPALRRRWPSPAPPPDA